MSCGLNFQRLRIQSGDGLTSPPFINRVDSLDENHIYFLLQKILASKLFLLRFAVMYSFFFIRWKKERETMGMEEIPDMPSLFGSLAGRICQSL